MKNIKLGDQVYEGVETVRLDTAEGGTVDYAPYDETFAAGRTEGYNAGKEAGLEEGFDNGKQAGIESEYDRFWDAYQENGKRVDYNYAFANWPDGVGVPKYDVAPVTASMMFAKTKIISIPEMFEKHGKRLDFSGCENMTSMFYWSELKDAGLVDTSSMNSLHGTIWCASLMERMLIRFKSDASQEISNAFEHLNKLNTLTVVGGTIGKDFKIQWSPLSTDSMKSVITHLKNYAGTADAGKYKVTFTETCWTALEADSTAPDGNTWRDYVETTLGWLT